MSCGEYAETERGEAWGEGVFEKVSFVTLYLCLYSLVRVRAGG